MTAEMLVRRVRPHRAGEPMLVRVMAGEVGALLCQWAAHLGATVIGNLGSAVKLDAAPSLLDLSDRRGHHRPGRGRPVYLFLE